MFMAAPEVVEVGIMLQAIQILRFMKGVMVEDTQASKMLVVSQETMDSEPQEGMGLSVAMFSQEELMPQKIPSVGLEQI
jgi:hypothetical protein